MDLKNIIKEELDQLIEDTNTDSSGSYETPKFLAKNYKNWKGAHKFFYKDSKMVKIKDKCKKFPYCNQGDIDALEFYNEKGKKVKFNETNDIEKG